jgi:hypothetical protein
MPPHRRSPPPCWWPPPHGWLAPGGRSPTPARLIADPRPSSSPRAAVHLGGRRHLRHLRRAGAFYRPSTYGANKLLAPKRRASGQQRQASVLSADPGRGPREAIFGRAATGGHLLDAFNFGGDNGTDWEVLVIKVADHKCDALEGF